MIQDASLGRFSGIAPASCRQTDAGMLLDEVEEGLGIFVNVFIGLVENDQLSAFHLKMEILVVNDRFLQARESPEVLEVSLVFAHQHLIDEDQVHFRDYAGLQSQECHRSGNSRFALAAFYNVDLLRVLLDELQRSLSYRHLQVVWGVCELAQGSCYRSVPVPHITVVHLLIVPLVEGCDILGNGMRVLHRGGALNFLQLGYPAFQGNREQRFLVSCSERAISPPELEPEVSKLFISEALLVPIPVDILKEDLVVEDPLKYHLTYK